jgi:putative membrane-bound dehydrogenase-like protein
MRGVVAVLLTLTALTPAPAPAGPPYAPADTLSRFRLDPGFRIELMASEPDIQSPIAMDIDERGRWFVLEMPGYPVDTRPTGRVKLLEDTDGDGRPDKSTVFADGLVLPTGIMCWRHGVIVTAAPDILYLEDRDGDGKADRREVLVTGFAVTNPQHRINTPLWGLDNWIYFAHEGPAEAVIYTDTFGDLGKPLTQPRFPDRPAVNPERRSVRLRPDSGDLEAIAGQSQYGHAFDAWGHYFGSNNSDHIRLEMLRAQYLARNPDLPIDAAMAEISDHGQNAKVFPITDHPTFELLTESGEFTSACSLTPYTGGLFTGRYARSTFVAEPVHNLVHRDVLEPSGSTLRATRGGEGREFLASTDSWFRPVAFYIGPDGALYVIDYYRKRIEHPEWTASEFQKNPSEFSLGSDRGRIYRVVPEGAQPANARPALDTANAGMLVAALESPNLWWRRTAQRLLVDGKHEDALPLLTSLAQDRARSALGRLHALWTLDGLGHLDSSLVRQALSDPEPGVRENALRMTDARLAKDASLAAAVVDRAGEEPDGGVQFQLLETLGFLHSADAEAAQSSLLFAHIDDPWMQRAALTAGPERAAQYLARAIAAGSTATASDTSGRRDFFFATGVVIGARHDRDELHRAIGATVERPSASAAWWQASLLSGLHDGLGGAAAKALEGERELLVGLADRSDPALRKAALDLLRATGLPQTATASAAVARAARLSTDRTVSGARRADAIRLMGIAGAASRETSLLAFVSPREPEVVQVAALESLQSIKGVGIAQEVLPRWPELTPGARSALADLLLTSPDRQRLLVAALKDGTVQPWALSFGQKRDLIMNDDAGIRADSRAILEDTAEHRAAVVNRYAAAVEHGGDAMRGQQVFTKVCAACHHLGGGTSADVGPDLATVRHRPPLSLLVDILSPSQSIAQGYETYVVKRTDGQTDAGALAAQSAGSITLRQAGKTVVIPRREIKQLTVLGQSTMPADLDKAISPEEMADLLAYVTKR